MNALILSLALMGHHDLIGSVEMDHFLIDYPVGVREVVTARGFRWRMTRTEPVYEESHKAIAPKASKKQPVMKRQSVRRVFTRRLLRRPLLRGCAG